MPLRVLIVDDHHAFADSLAIAIDVQGDLECIGTAGTVDEALAHARRNPPDVVLMDVDLPGADGLEGTVRLKELCPEAKVLILTGRTDLGVVGRAADAGASGFLPKESRVADVIESIRSAGQGQMLIDARTLSLILASTQRAQQKAARRPAVDLTPRELSVLALMGEGMDPKAIAERFTLSIHTSRGYVKTILAKLGARSQLEAVVKAMRLGLIALPTDP